MVGLSTRPAPEGHHALYSPILPMVNMRTLLFLFSTKKKVYLLTVLMLTLEVAASLTSRGFIPFSLFIFRITLHLKRLFFRSSASFLLLFLLVLGDDTHCMRTLSVAALMLWRLSYRNYYYQVFPLFDYISICICVCM